MGSRTAATTTTAKNLETSNIKLQETNDGVLRHTRLPLHQVHSKCVFFRDYKNRKNRVST